jgi:hypothetical protein
MSTTKDLEDSNPAKGQWHWGEGMKYALEGIKTLFILNGAAALAMLTFIGNTKTQSGPLVAAMVFFAVGAFMGAPTLWCAYLTQLNYGNACMHIASDPSHATTWEVAVTWQNWTYIFAAGGLILFLGGVVTAACGLLRLS